ncbi:hypothetical protein GUU_00080 [Malacoplasma iowae 695]|nr:hypothetical protein GUU_00080 [Malacoplasma iowae 695]
MSFQVIILTIIVSLNKICNKIFYLVDIKMLF